LAEATKKISGLNMFVFYPDLSSAKDPKNAPFLDACIGYCGGRLLISVANRGLRTGYSSATAAIAEARMMRWPRLSEQLSANDKWRSAGVGRHGSPMVARDVGRA
jgi:hypothetical protein